MSVITVWHHSGPSTIARLYQLGPVRGEGKIDPAAGDTLFEKHEGFRSAYRIALGTTYYYDDNWTFRTGIAFDGSRYQRKTVLSLFGRDRFWLSAGTTPLTKIRLSTLASAYMHRSRREN